MGAMASQITSLPIVYSTVYSGRDHQSSASRAFVREIYQWALNSPHKRPVTRKKFPFDVVMMWCTWTKQSTTSIFRKLQRIAFTGDVNFALNRPASQSTTQLDRVAGYAVDGITDNDKLCSHTATGDIHPWWKVQLAFPINVTHVEITNRIISGEWCANIGNRYLLWCQLCLTCWHRRSS